MKYEEAKNLNPQEFKRLCGVIPDTFSTMVSLVKQAELEKQVSGRPAKLSIEDQVLMTLAYWREYRTYFHIATDWGIHESNANRIIRKIEDILIKSQVFSLPGKKSLYSQDSTPKVVVIDVTESAMLVERWLRHIERPKKNRKNTTQGKRKIIH